MKTTRHSVRNEVFSVGDVVSYWRQGVCVVTTVAKAVAASKNGINGSLGSSALHTSAKLVLENGAEMSVGGNLLGVSRIIRVRHGANG